jgi:hypothetical protein
MEYDMTQIPANAVTQEDLNAWIEMQQKLGALKSAEMLLRMKIFKGLFPHPVEGTNSVPLGNEGWVIKAKYPIIRKPDVALLTARAQELREAGIPLDTVIRTIPELATGEYRKLSDEQRHLLDQVMEIKAGSPALEIVLPKRAVAA